MKKPLKRHEALIPLSRDHHHSLLLCWKIREGLKKGIEEERMKRYNDYFYSTQIITHFDFEEAEIFPLLGNDHPLVIQALEEHKRIRFLFQQTDNLPSTFEAIQKELNDHVRFEERILFTKIQEETPEEKFQAVMEKEDQLITPDPDAWEDQYWQKKK